MCWLNCLSESEDDNSEIYESVEVGPSHTQVTNNAFVAPDNHEGDDNG